VGQATILAVPSASRLGERAARALPAAVVLALAAFMVERDGGFAPTIWSPIALLLVAFAATVFFSGRRLVGGAPRTTILAVCLLGALAVFEFVTIAWAGVRGDAWNGSNRDLMYLVVFGLLALWPVTTGSVWPVLLVFSAVVGGEGAWTVHQFIHAADPSQFAIGTRLSEPLGYPNATGALYMMLFWLMLGLASRRFLPPWARGIAVGLAVLDATLNLLTESRGSIFTLPAVALFYFVFVPGRFRSAAMLAVVAAAFAPVVQPVLDVYGAAPADLSSALGHALDLGLVFSVLGGIAGFLAASFDERWTPSPRTARVAAISLLTAVAAALVVVLVATTPWSRLGSAWHSFKYGGEPSGAVSHFGGLGSARYDIWRVGLIEFRQHPAGGIGADNFLVPYLQQRHSEQSPLYPHSLAVRLLSQTGVVGTLVFLGFVVCAALTILRIPPGRRRELARILTVGVAVWFLHGLVDWLWEMPMLGVFGLALLGLACGLAPRSTDAPAASRSLRRIAYALGGAAALAAAVSLALPWLADREVNAAASTWRADPEAAFRTLNRADDLDPLSDQADLVAGAIASRLHRYPVMRDRFAAAVGRSPDDWYANLELGIAASLTGRHDEAAAALARASRLNPREPLVRSVLATFLAGRRIDSDAVDRAAAASD
jgi:hypothetical protein